MTRIVALPAVTLTILLFALQPGAARANRNGAALPEHRVFTLLQEDAGKKSSAAGVPERPEDIVRRLHSEFEGTLDKLEKRDAGAATRDLQKKIVEDLEKLINQRDNKSGKPAAGQDDAQKTKPSDPQASQKNSDSLGKAPASDTAPPGKPNQLQNAPKALGPAAGKNAPKQSLGRWGDLQKWEQPQADVYGGQRYMPKYEELLRQYYRVIAEEGLRKPRE
jgi:hypothetical protein